MRGAVKMGVVKVGGVYVRRVVFVCGDACQPVCSHVGGGTRRSVMCTPLSAYVHVCTATVNGHVRLHQGWTRKWRAIMIRWLQGLRVRVGEGSKSVPRN